MYVGRLEKMRFSTCVISLCFAASGAGIALSANAIPLSTSSDLSNAQLPAQAESVTLLRFETAHYLVRVYREGGLTYLNVYNKETGYTDKNGAIAYLASPESEDDNWRTYVNQQGDLEYRAKVNPEGRTELEIRVAGGEPAQPEPGFNATYSFPHMYLGENLEKTLEELKESGWVVDSTEQEVVELVRNQLSLDIKFNPSTRVITYTQLADLT